MCSKKGRNAGQQIGTRISKVAGVQPTTLGKSRLHKQIVKEIASRMRIAGARHLRGDTVLSRDTGRARVEKRAVFADDVVIECVGVPASSVRVGCAQNDSIQAVWIGARSARYCKPRQRAGG